MFTGGETNKPLWSFCHNWQGPELRPKLSRSPEHWTWARLPVVTLGWFLHYQLHLCPITPKCLKQGRPGTSVLRHFYPSILSVVVSVLQLWACTWLSILSCVTLNCGITSYPALDCQADFVTRDWDPVKTYLRICSELGAYLHCVVWMFTALWN